MKTSHPCGEQNITQNLRFAAIAVALFGTTPNIHAQEASSKSYMRFDAGAALQQDLTIRDSGGAKISYDTGFRFDVIGGGRFNESWSAELEVGMIHNSVKTIGGVPLSSTGESLDHYQFPMMVNVVYKLPFRGRLSAHVGAGIGGVYSWFWGGNILNSSTDLTFGYQGMLGVNYAITKRWDLGLAYKFLGTTEHDLGSGVKADGTRSHALLAAATFNF